MSSALLLATFLVAAPVKAKPPMRDFIGLNTHTVQFRTDLYQPVTRLVRNYHPMAWDLGDDLSGPAAFPKTKNGIDWKELYGKWKAAGYRTEASLQFESIDPAKWKEIPKTAHAYGESFARYFGPSGANKLVELAEIGNEPEKFDKAQYRTMFENMAKGMRAGDPKMLIAPCAVAVGDEDKYSKNVEVLKGLESLYDVLNVHTYAFVEGWPTWRRSFPEDPKIAYLKAVEKVIAWRNENAKGKQIWITEFGYDSTTKKPEPTGDFAKWEGVSDELQARYIVRSYLTFSAMDIDRAYLYWFNDEDKPSLHASSGLTRNYQPKPSFHAVAHLLRTLGDYRFSRTVSKEDGGLYVYEYAISPRDRVWAVWSATGTNRTAEVTLPPFTGQAVRAERMPLKAGPPEAVAVKKAADGRVHLTVGESPTYVWLKG